MSDFIRDDGNIIMRFYDKHPDSHVRLDLAKILIEEFEEFVATLSVSEGGWIDCKQELPPNNKVVLVSATGYFEVVVYRHKCIASRAWKTHNDVAIQGVTHWMPLPPAPKVSKEEGGGEG